MALIISDLALTLDKIRNSFYPHTNSTFAIGLSFTDDGIIFIVKTIEKDETIFCIKYLGTTTHTHMMLISNYFRMYSNIVKQIYIM